MTFDEWIKQADWKWQDPYIVLREAWDAAIASEREACANLCKANAVEQQVMLPTKLTDTVRSVISLECAELIMMRNEKDGL